MIDFGHVGVGVFVAKAGVFGAFGTCSGFVVDDSIVVFADDIDPEFPNESDEIWVISDQRVE